MSYSMYIDDLRTPQKKYDIVVRSYEEAIKYVLNHGMPSYISFDHDLGLSCDGIVAKNGYDFARWLIESSLDGKLKFPVDFSFWVHSANPVGKRNIESILNNYLNFIRDKE